MNFAIEFIKADAITSDQQASLDALNIECFGDVPTKEITENFIAEPFGYLFAMVGKEMISRVSLFKREVVFDGQKILTGGMGGVCVTTDHRHHGVASSMVKRAILILTQEHCDVACLNVDLDKNIYHLYEKLGFTLMPRNISFENIRGEIIHEPGNMFVALNSPEKYQLIMNSPATFHYGRGYW
jgi:predicted GNAT family N-acyltransferase